MENYWDAVGRGTEPYRAGVGLFFFAYQKSFLLVTCEMCVGPRARSKIICARRCDEQRDWYGDSVVTALSCADA